MDERLRRQWAAVEARAIGYGGISVVSRATGLSRPTIQAGLQELKQGRSSRLLADGSPPAQVRRKGAGRKPLSELDPKLLTELEGLLESCNRGDPQSLSRSEMNSLASSSRPENGTIRLSAS